MKVNVLLLSVLSKMRKHFKFFSLLSGKNASDRSSSCFDIYVMFQSILK